MKWMSSLQDFSEPSLYCDSPNECVQHATFSSLLLLLWDTCRFRQGCVTPQPRSRMAKPGPKGEEGGSDLRLHGRVPFLPLLFLSPMAGWLSTRVGVTVGFPDAEFQPAPEPHSGQLVPDHPAFFPLGTAAAPCTWLWWPAPVSLPSSRMRNKQMFQIKKTEQVRD